MLDNEHSMYSLWSKSGGKSSRLHGSGPNSSLDAGFKEHINEYLAGLKWSKVRTLDELIQFNKDNAAEELPSGFSPTGFNASGSTDVCPDYPNQDMLIAAAEINMPRDHHDKLLAHARLIGGEEGIDAALKRWDIDVILAPGDSAYNLLVSAAGTSSRVNAAEGHSLIQYRLSFSDHAIVVPRVQWQTHRTSSLHYRAPGRYSSQSS